MCAACGKYSLMLPELWYIPVSVSHCRFVLELICAVTTRKTTRPQFWTWYTGAGKVNPGWKNMAMFAFAHNSPPRNVSGNVRCMCAEGLEAKLERVTQSDNNLHRSYRQDSWLDEQTPIWCVPPGSPANTAHTKPSSETLCGCETFP